MEGTEATVEQNGNKAKITYTTDKYSQNTKVQAYVYDENGEVKVIELDPKKPGVYEAQIDTKDTGIYTINVQQKEGEDIISSINTAAIMQYSLEYRFYPDNTLLEDFVASTGGAFIEKPDEVFKITPEFVKARFNLWIPLLILASFIFLFDIAVRRFHISFAFVDQMAAKKQLNKQKAMEEKRKKEAEDLKNEVATMSESHSDSPVSFSEKASSKSAKAKTKVMTKPEAQNSAAQTPQSDVISAARKSAPKKSEEPKKVITKTFERKPEDMPKPPVNKPVNNSDEVNTNYSFAKKNPAPAANKEVKNTGSITNAGLKTRVWVRDDDK